MPDDSFTEVTSTSWFSRIGKSITGIIAAPVLLVGAVGLLFWNEGRAVQDLKTLAEGAQAVVPLADTRVDQAKEGRLVHVHGPLESQETLTDPVFGVQVQGLRLRRKVEMYQWKESQTSSTTKKLGGGSETVTTYSYTKTWSEDLIGSSGFKDGAHHQNPASMPCEAADLISAKATLGGFQVPTTMIAGLATDRAVTPALDGPGLHTLGKPVSLSGGALYVGHDPADAQIGDARITFAATSPTEVSIMAKQVGSTFAPYLTSAGGTISMIKPGVHPPQAMIAAAEERSRTMTWLLRAAGLVMMFIGVNLLFAPLAVLADVLPILGDLVEMATGLVAFLIASILTLATVAVAWLWFRPLLSLGLLIGIAGLAWLIRQRFPRHGLAGIPLARQPVPA